ncbi:MULTISPECIES: amidohydrolase [unclassified Cetobacterium]|uniref:amidohydrolase n=1 Tax=unclassified Cetobacterium TaxID=2630983 RepID=UPI0006474EC6|nr:MULTISPECIES: amidohydrolase [unclassified Cetobacterium]
MGKNYVEQLFDRLHEIPERGFEEFETSKILISELEKYDFKIHKKVGGTGIVAIYDSGKPGPILALRADMDALEFIVDGRVVNIHACGHDANCAMVMAAAKYCKEKGIKKGILKIIFQPAEELTGGALAMLKDPRLGKIDELIGIHLRPIEDMKLGEASEAVYHSATVQLRYKIKGLSAHGARPHLGVSALEAAVLATNAVNSIKINPAVNHSIKVTNISVEGRTYNKIPSEALLALDIRSESNEVMSIMKEKVKVAVDMATKSIGATAEEVYFGEVIAATYDEEMVQTCKIAIEKVLGKSYGRMVNYGGEDFHYFTRDLKCKSSYLGIGAEAVPGLHHEKMTFKKEALTIGEKILIEIVSERLGVV